MTAPLSPWPPTKETLEGWADFARGEDMDQLEAFLRDERLAAALALWEAVEFMGARVDFEVSWGGVVGACPWHVTAWRNKEKLSGIGDTLPEAVQALKARLHQGKEEPRG